MTIFRVIDTEGNLVGGIVEVASLDVMAGEYTNPQSDLLSPPDEISIEAMSIHHITYEMVAGKPLLEEVMPKYLGADYYIAHNAPFDRSKLPLIPAETPWICTLKLSRYFYPDLPKHNNQYMRYALQLNVTVPDDLYPHRALYDCYVTAALLVHFATVCECSIEGMLQITNTPSLLSTIYFGKHKNTKWADIDKGFLNWCLKNMENLDEDTRYTIEYYLTK
ncbi:exodeoxyribonuclease X [Ewingella americana]|uniref:Exodeoxyribonuclease X n=1 Tax=Ewingella americana TaxID=41202 RepID=A0A502GD01_9GAMM|nr:exodeoxyribonuclease X [Ewingella americana]TPG59969.1 exodeoxyribonuclease X [Ewingella americana]